ncbi:hypothetical protein MRS44_012869 [Fusarium solani]|uniref:uncharacterized protein n=1 Tax=Fusarium solani TaxID=169388 RepID=UPI0032C3EAC8|nr:hypothetical protein MRS44_012869 [Fusarium solani]
MKLSIFVSALTLVTSALAGAVELPAGVPRSVDEFRQKHQYTPPSKRSHRKVFTIRASKNDHDDVSSEFYKGLKRANKGGTLHLTKGHTYVIGKPLDLTWLDNVHVHLDGEIKFTNDTGYWQKNSFTHPFQNSIMFWKWGGKNIKIYGNGVLNGNGQRWWNEFAGKEILDKTNQYLRPILFYAENATGLDIQGIHFKDSPCWTNFVVTSKDISFKDVVCTAHSNNATSLPKNTDFFDSLNVEHLTVERAWVDIGDDCFSPKSNASDVYVNTMYCNGTHGQSIGSLGQYKGEKSFVKDVVIENVWMLNGQHGARLKTWAGPDVGYGFIDNVTFRNFWGGNNEYTAFIDSCYFNIDEATCAKYPSQMNITNILFENFTGYSSGKYGDAIARLTCSSNPNAVCENIKFKNFDIKTPCGGKPVVICDGVSDIGMDCVSATSKEAKAALANKCTAPAASACPKLRRIELQAATEVGEDALLALFENCPALTYLELSGISRGNDITGVSLDALRENPEWAPKLKRLILGEKDDNEEFMKAMRALGKERQAMTITLVSRHEEKKWGDWELVTTKQNYKKGRKHGDVYDDDHFNPFYSRYNRFW